MQRKAFRPEQARATSGVIKSISKLDKFNAEWPLLEKHCKVDVLERLKSRQLAESTGASLRLEGKEIEDDLVAHIFTKPGSKCFSTLGGWNPSFCGDFERIRRLRLLTVVCKRH